MAHSNCVYPLRSSDLSCTGAQEGRKTSARFLRLGLKCVPLSLPAALRSQKTQRQIKRQSFIFLIFSRTSSFLCCFWKWRARSATDQNSSRSLSIVNIFEPTLSYVRVPCFTGPSVAQAKKRSSWLSETDSQEAVKRGCLGKTRTIYARLPLVADIDVFLCVAQ